MGGGFPSGELMLVAQKSQTGSGPEIFSWMNVMLTLSKGFFKRNNNKRLCLFTLRLFPNQGGEHGQRYVHLQAVIQRHQIGMFSTHIISHIISHNCPNALGMGGWVGGVLIALVTNFANFPLSVYCLHPAWQRKVFTILAINVLFKF